MTEATIESRVDRIAAAMDTHRDQLSSLMTSMESMQNRFEAIEVSDVSNEDSFRIVHTRIDRVREIQQALAAAIENPTPTPPDRAELYTALVAAQLEIKNAEENQEMKSDKYSFKYADLASVMDAVREPLAKNGLVIIQLTADGEGGLLGIRTILAHTSGQTITDLITMHPPRNDPQGVGSCRTYMRRYAVLAICAIAGAVDDDAEATRLDPEDYARITADEIDNIIATADELFADKADFVVQQMCEKTFDITHVSHIKAGEADLAITRLKNTARREKEKAKKGADVKPSPKPPEDDGK